MLPSPFSVEITPDCDGFIRCLRRQGTPRRVHFIELFLDREVEDAICSRYNLLAAMDMDDPFFPYRRQIRLQSFLGYDYVVFDGGVENTAFINLPLRDHLVADVATLPREKGRAYVEEHRGPITTWEEFEAYPFPTLGEWDNRSLDWLEANLPENMCLIGGLTGHIYENLSFLMGYETLSFALYDQRDLVAAISQKLVDLYCWQAEHLLRSSRVKALWGSDDLGFRSNLLISPRDLREFVLPGHRRLASMAHDSGKLYLLHSCGQLSRIMEELIEDVKIDARHSFEDTIMDVRLVKAAWGDRLSLLGGIDLDFLCRSTPAEVRARVRDTLERCMPGGGYCLGTGNSVANYVPLENYLAMLDEGRRWQS